MELRIILVKFHSLTRISPPNDEGGEKLKSVHVMITLEDSFARLDRVEDHIVVEAWSHFYLVMREVEALWEDVERLQLMVENLAAKVYNFNMKVDQIEVTVEASIVGFLKDVLALMILSLP